MLFCFYNSCFKNLNLIILPLDKYYECCFIIEQK